MSRPNASSGDHTNRVSKVFFGFREITDYPLSPSREKSETVRDKWIYVFQLKNGSASLEAEIFVDGSAELKEVEWAENDWRGQDERPPNIEREVFVLEPEPNSSVWMCLSQIQLPRARIREYEANPTLVTDRCQCVLTIPGPIVLGGFFFGDWAEIPASSNEIFVYGTAYLVDAISIAQSMQKRYLDELNEYIKTQAEVDEQGNKLILAHLAKQTAEQYQKEENGELPYYEKALEEYIHKYDLDRYKDEKEDVASVKFEWMSADFYEETREDYMFDVGDLKSKCLENEAIVHEGTLLSEAGWEYLNDRITERKSWHARNFLDPATRESELNFPCNDSHGDFAEIITNIGVALARQNAESFRSPRWVNAVEFYRWAIQNWLGLSESVSTTNDSELDPEEYIGLDGFPNREEFNGFEGVRTLVESYLGVGDKAMDLQRWREKPKVKMVRAAAFPLLAALALINIVEDVSSLSEASSAEDKTISFISVGASVAAGGVLLAGALGAKVTGAALGSVAVFLGGIIVGAYNLSQSVKTSEYIGSGLVLLGSFVGLMAGLAITIITKETLGSAAAAAAAFKGAIWAGLIGVAIVAVGVTIIIIFADDPYEEWFRHCEWGYDPSGDSIEEQLHKLLQLIGRPQITVNCMALSDSQLDVELSVVPLFFIPGQTEITVDLKLQWVDLLSARKDNIELPSQTSRVNDDIRPRITTTIVDFPDGEYLIERASRRPGEMRYPRLISLWRHKANVTIEYLSGLGKLHYEFVEYHTDYFR